MLFLHFSIDRKGCVCLCLQHASKSNVPVILLIPGDTLSVTHTSQVYQRDFCKFDSHDLGEQQGLNHSPQLCKSLLWTYSVAADLCYRHLYKALQSMGRNTSIQYTQIHGMCT